MSITFYTAPNSSATPVTCALAELNLAHERIEFVLAEGKQRSPEFLALNPNGKVPTLVVDGAPFFEALAIVQWLGERYGVAQGLWPAPHDPARFEALSWSTWAYASYGVRLHRVAWAHESGAPPEVREASVVQSALASCGELLGVLDARLSKSPYFLGEEFSFVDLIVSQVVIYSTYLGVSLEPHPQVKAWAARCSARPSYQLP